VTLQTIEVISWIWIGIRWQTSENCCNDEDSWYNLLFV